MNSHLEDRANVSGHIQAFVRSWAREGCFDEIALELFQYQYRWNAAYRRYCDSLGANPENVATWEDAPAAPSEAFRSQPLNCCPLLAPATNETPTAPPDPALGVVFLSSGTTEPAARSAHWMDPPAVHLYELSLRMSFDRLASRAAGLPIISLIATREQAPMSSLSFMVSSLAGRSPGGVSFWQGSGPDLKGAEAALRALDKPVLLFTTAFGLLELLDFLPSPITMPAGSMLIETGGFKGRRRAIEREDLYTAASEALGVPRESIGAEYGMCEMASQFYDAHLGDTVRIKSPHAAPVKIGPPWVRTRILDPATGRPVASGEPGLLTHYDLCNLNSVMGIASLDLGTAAVAGAHAGFILHGRATQEGDRGCSLTVEEWRDAR